MTSSASDKLMPAKFLSITSEISSESMICCSLRGLISQAQRWSLTMSDQSQFGRGAIVALAGRRVDPVDADTRRFPLENVTLVRKRLSELFVAERATALVSSAACGADLAALEAAERLGLRWRIVLPFAPERFRQTSVIDRPGDWGPVFDRLIAQSRIAGDL